MKEKVYLTKVIVEVAIWDLNIRTEFGGGKAWIRRDTTISVLVTSLFDFGINWETSKTKGAKYLMEVNILGSSPFKV